MLKNPLRIVTFLKGIDLEINKGKLILKNPSHGFVEEFIGKNRIWNQPEFIKAEDIVIKEPVKTLGNRTILQAAEIMSERHVDSIIVVDHDNKLKGIVTLKDIRKNREKKLTLNDLIEKKVIAVNKDD